MKYNKESLNARMAEVMGWEHYLGDKDYWLDGKVVQRRCDWQPTEDANQALMVLEKCSKNALVQVQQNDNGVLYEVSVDDWISENAYGIVGEAEHASLPVAICLAVASAKDGQQATLEEV